MLNKIKKWITEWCAIKPVRVKHGVVLKGVYLSVDGADVIMRCDPVAFRITKTVTNDIDLGA